MGAHAKLASEICTLGASCISTVSYRAAYPNCLLRIESIEVVDRDALTVEAKQWKQRDSEDRKTAAMQRKM